MKACNPLIMMIGVAVWVLLLLLLAAFGAQTLPPIICFGGYFLKLFLCVSAPRKKHPHPQFKRIIIGMIAAHTCSLLSLCWRNQSMAAREAVKMEESRFSRRLPFIFTSHAKQFISCLSVCLCALLPLNDTH